MNLWKDLNLFFKKLYWIDVLGIVNIRKIVFNEKK